MLGLMTFTYRTKGQICLLSNNLSSKTEEPWRNRIKDGKTHNASNEQIVSDVSEKLFFFFRFLQRRYWGVQMQQRTRKARQAERAFGVWGRRVHSHDREACNSSVSLMSSWVLCYLKKRLNDTEEHYKTIWMLIKSKKISWRHFCPSYSDCSWYSRKLF